MMAFGCRNHNRMAEYQRKIDSIKKAETTKTMLPVPDNREPLTVFFDSLTMIALPLHYTPEFVEYLPQMTPVPKLFNSSMGCEGDQKLKAAILPPTPHFNMVLLAERMDSITPPTLYLCVFDHDNVMQDRLTIYERADGDLNGEIGSMKLEYSVTSRYEVTLMRFFRSDNKPDADFEWKESRKFHINREGHFEEEPADL